MDRSPEISKLSVNNLGDSQLGFGDVYANVNISNISQVLSAALFARPSRAEAKMTAWLFFLFFLSFQMRYICKLTDWYSLEAFLSGSPLQLFHLFTLLAQTKRLAGLLKDGCHSFILVPLPTCRFLLLSSPNTDLWVSEDDGCGEALKSCLYVPQMASARSQSTALNQSAIPLLSTRRLRWIIFVPIENFFFFPLPPFFLVISLKDNVPECPCAFPPGCFWLFLPSLPASHPMFSFLCLNFAGPCRQSGPRTPAPTPSPCISKGSESAVAKAQGEQHNSTHDAMRRSSS